ncbi:ABC transporter ATP-binding protein [Pseudoduganella namucuonensis]|uniref:Putative ABC transport system ATP-binding protein n=1 Tax=Pseudoduganella namucuonensis TaxID=1035707 RepID=A0A1I7LBV7_9BURK|nr:ABC transporter ATP-binding protein [Pseudoduganella namucuonensis]SFV07160.1 putative ABC transport system ATP-binding protein [Pseudoduganella namucuonensis]
MNAAAEPLMSLRGISKSFTLGGNTIHALRNVDLAVLRGEIAAITGPSGSGKSTLLNLCGLLDTADGGEMLYAGQPLPAADDARKTLLRRQTIGFVFQSFNLVPVMNAYDNVDFPLYLLGVPAAERVRRVNGALERVGLAGLGKHRPDQLSGGQRQRVAIARAIVKHPQLVIADEPTANLDAATAAQIIALMKDLAHEHGTTFLVATHDDRMLGHCDRALALADGVLLEGARHAH